jgi:hypothetical protein
MLWLATNDYNTAPPKKDGKVNLGTEPTVTAEWSSPWIGCKAEDCAKWIQKKPHNVDLDSNHFAVLDGEARNKSVLLYKIGDLKLQGDALSSKRISARMASVKLGGMDAGEWEGI